jgi:hypothetical protein
MLFDTFRAPAAYTAAAASSLTTNGLYSSGMPGVAGAEGGLHGVHEQPAGLSSLAHCR